MDDFEKLYQAEREEFRQQVKKAEKDVPAIRYSLNANEEEFEELYDDLERTNKNIVQKYYRYYTDYDELDDLIDALHEFYDHGWQEPINEQINEYIKYNEQLDDIAKELLETLYDLEKGTPTCLINEIYGQIEEITHLVARAVKVVGTAVEVCTIDEDVLEEARDFADELIKWREDNEYAEKHHLLLKEVDLHKNYSDAVNVFKKAKKSTDFENAKSKFKKLSGYLDSKDYIAKCTGNAKLLKKKEEEEAAAKKKDEIYSSALSKMKFGYGTIEEFEEAISLFESLGDWKDSVKNIGKCRKEIIKLQKQLEEKERKEKERRLEEERRAEEERREAERRAEEERRMAEKARIAALTERYEAACSVKDRQFDNISVRISELNAAVSELKDLNGFKDAERVCDEFEQLIEELKAELAVIKQKKKKKAAVITALCLTATVCVLLIIFVILPGRKYKQAQLLFESGSFEDSAALFGELGDFSDSAKKQLEAKYAQAEELLNKKDYVKSIEIFSELGNFSDSPRRKNEANYQYALYNLNAGNYKESYEQFLLLADYSDSKSKMAQAGYRYGKELIAAQKYSVACDVFGNVGKYEDAPSLLSESYRGYAEQLYNEKKYADAVKYYKKCTDFNEYSELYRACRYNIGLELFEKKNYSKSANVFGEDYLIDYKDAYDYYLRSMYEYVLQNRNNDDNTTLLFLTALNDAYYKDSAAIFDELYSWKVDIVANTNKNYKTYESKYFNRRNDWYFHIELSGGKPNESTKLYYKGIYPDGDQKTNEWEGVWQEGSTGWCSFGYTYFTGDYGLGTFTLIVYDEDYNVIGEKSIEIT